MKIITILLSLLLLSACQILPDIQQHPTHYYVLSSEAKDSTAEGVQKHADACLLLMPALLPKYLDRPHIVSRTQANQLDYSEFDLWAEPLNEGILRVMASALGDRLDKTSIFVFPRESVSGSKQTYYLRHSIHTFEATSDRRVILEVKWSIHNQDRSTVYVEKHTKVSLPFKGASTQDKVAAMGDAVRLYVDEVAAAMKAL